MYIASCFAVSPGEEDKALDLYDQLNTYQAAYNTSQVCILLHVKLFTVTCKLLYLHVFVYIYLLPFNQTSCKF